MNAALVRALVLLPLALAPASQITAQTASAQGQRE